MPKGTRYSNKDKEEMVAFIIKAKGNVKQAHKDITDRGSEIKYETLLKFWKQAGHRGMGSGGARSEYTTDQQQEAVKILELNGFQHARALKQLKEMGYKIQSHTLRKWYETHGREVCEGNRFKDSVKKLAENLTMRHEKMVGLVYTSKEMILNRFIELIPLETDLNRLANAYKVLEEASLMKDMSEKPMTLIQQFNNYISDKQLHENKKDTNKGNVQDATLVNE